VRTIDYTGGEREYLTATVTERYAASLAGVTFQVGLGTANTKPAAWAAADLVVLSGTNDEVAKVSMLIDAAGDIGADKRLWVKVTDSPEVLFLVCANEAITVT
jgi:hypothetical protein